MGSHSITCNPTEVRIPPLPPAEAGTRFSDPGRMQGWIDLCYVKATGRELNLRPVNRKSNALPRRLCFVTTVDIACCVQILVETLTLGAPLLLPPLHERMELLHSLLPHGPAGWDSLSPGQVH